MRLLKREEGAAMMVVMLVLLVLSLLAAMVLRTSTQASSTTNRASSSIRALAAANQGLQLARYRLSSIGAKNNECFTTTGVARGPSACPTQTDTGGYGAAYTYAVSPALAISDPCAGLWLNTSRASTQRCITSIGTVNGVSRRVQLRVASYLKAGRFPVNGMFALNQFTSSGTFAISGDVGSNGNVSLPNSASVTGTVGYVPPSTFKGLCAAPSCTLTAKSAPYPIDTSDPGFASSKAANNNSAIAWPSGVYDPTTRVVSASGKVGTVTNPIVIPSGVYNFCNFRFGNDTFLTLAPGARVSIFVDSPNRPNGCASGNGEVSVTGKMSFLNPSGDPSALQIFAYGNPGGSPTTFKFNNVLNSSAEPFYALIYAPDSAFTTSNTVKMKGGVVANTITTSNSISFTGDAGGALQSGSSSVFYPSAWRECPPTTTSPDITSAC